jgi:hypothetical protein
LKCTNVIIWIEDLEDNDDGTFICLNDL